MVAESTTIESAAVKPEVKSPRRWTYSELQALGDERRVELYDGELVEMTSPKLRHQQILRRLLRILEAAVEERDIGTLYLSPVDLYVSETKFFVPDLCFVMKERFASERVEREDDACLIAPPDLIVEVISPSTARKDRVDKFNVYAAFGVRYYWIVDPNDSTLHAYLLESGRYLAEAALSAEDTFEPSLFPGLQISLAHIFNE